MNSKIQIIETSDRRDIEEIENIETKYYKENALKRDILIPAVNFLGFILIAKINKIIGYAVFISTKKEKEMYCAALTVIPEYRRKGVATDLLEKAEEKCKEMNIKTLIATGNLKNIASSKTFLNSRNWYVKDLKINFYKDNLNSFIYKKSFKKEIQFLNKEIIDIDSLEKIISLLKEGYVGTKIIDDKKIQMEKISGD